MFFFLLWHDDINVTHRERNFFSCLYPYCLICIMICFTSLFFFYRLAEQYTAVCVCVLKRNAGQVVSQPDAKPFHPFLIISADPFCFVRQLGTEENKRAALDFSIRFFPLIMKRLKANDDKKKQTKGLSTKISVSEDPSLLGSFLFFFFSLVSHKNINKDPSAARQQPKCHKYSGISDSPAVITSASTSYPASEKVKS